MAETNKNYDKLQGAYLFSEIAKRARDFAKKNPNAKIIHLGIGNTTRPLTPSVVRGLQKGVAKLASQKTYTGYGDEQGNLELRKMLAKFYKKRKIKLDPQEIFISDGAKSDLANLQSIFSQESVVAVADPVYTVYVDASVIGGHAGTFKNGKYTRLVYMKCDEKNGFVPTPPRQKVGILYLCSPNNPTGAVINRKQLKVFVDYALKNKAVIIFDAAYAEYIRDKSLPKSIYEIPGAKKCAIEVNSFSKWAGFTGVRLGWTVVPMDLVVADVSKNKMRGKLNNLWHRRQTTMFNGASNIAQEGALAVLSPKGLKENKKLVDYYMRNAKVMHKGLSQMGFEVFGGENAPYIWMKTPKGFTSWRFFDKLLNEAHVVATPGFGFGAEGEGYIRFSAFGSLEDTKKGIASIKKNLRL